MTEEAKKKAGMKLTERKFMVPISGMMATFFNGIAGLGLSTEQLLIIVGASLVYAGIETWHDVAKMRYSK